MREKEDRAKTERSKKVKAQKLTGIALQRLTAFRENEAEKTKQGEIWWRAFHGEVRRMVANGETDRKIIKSAATQAADEAVV